MCVGNQDADQIVRLFRQSFDVGQKVGRIALRVQRKSDVQNDPLPVSGDDFDRRTAQIFALNSFFLRP